MLNGLIILKRWHCFWISFTVYVTGLLHFPFFRLVFLSLDNLGVLNGAAIVIFQNKLHCDSVFHYLTCLCLSSKTCHCNNQEWFNPGIRLHCCVLYQNVDMLLIWVCVSSVESGTFFFFSGKNVFLFGCLHTLKQKDFSVRFTKWIKPLNKTSNPSLVK